MKASKLIEMIEAKVERSTDEDPEVAIFEAGGPRLYFTGLPEESDYFVVGDHFDSPLRATLREVASTVIPVKNQAEALAIHQRRQAELRTGKCLDPACPIEPKPHKVHGGRIS